MIKKAIALFLAAATGTAVLISGGCSSKEQATSATSGTQAKQTVVFWDENSGPNRTPYFQELIKRFEAKNKNITVQYVGLPSSDAKQKVDVAIAGNDVPDVLGLMPNWISNLVTKNALAPLDSYFDKWSEKDQTPKTYIDNLRSVVPDKKLYCLPNSATFGPIFWYRSDWFKDAGIQAPQTWNDFFSDAKLMTDKSKGRYGYSIRGGSGGPVQLQTFLYAYSGITEPFTKEGKSTLNDPKNLEALQKLAALYKTNTPESDISNGYKEMVAAFDSGSVAMIQHNLGSYGENQQTLGAGKFAAFVAPKSASGKRVIDGIIALNCYAVMKQSKVKDASWEFMSYLCSKDAQNYFNQNIGQVPTNMSLSSESWVTGAQHISLALATEKDSSTVAFADPLYLPDYQSIQDTLVLPDFQAVLSGKMTAKQLLDDWANAMTKAQTEYTSSSKK